MNRLAICSMLAFATGLWSCGDAPTGPGSTGRIVIEARYDTDRAARPAGVQAASQIKITVAQKGRKVAEKELRHQEDEWEGKVEVGPGFYTVMLEGYKDAEVRWYGDRIVKVVSGQTTQALIYLVDVEGPPGIEVEEELLVTTPGGTEHEMLLVPEGEFLMGNNNDGERFSSPEHMVYLDAFYIDKYEVTRAQYQACMEAGACRTPPSSSSGDHHQNFFEPSRYPINSVNWEEAETYCEWAGLRLPTEAEWEKAGRGMDGRMYPWGDEFNNYQDCFLVNFNGGGSNPGCDGYVWSAPVGTFPAGASPYGAQNMAGNVYEWVADWFDGTYYSRSPERNPTGPSNPDQRYDARVVRGGSHSSPLNFLQVTFRYSSEGSRSPNHGFRCARDR